MEGDMRHLSPEYCKNRSNNEVNTMVELTYSRYGDYYIPNLKLSEQPTSPSANMAVCGNAI